MIRPNDMAVEMRARRVRCAWWVVLEDPVPEKHFSASRERQIRFACTTMRPCHFRVIEPGGVRAMRVSNRFNPRLHGVVVAAFTEWRDQDSSRPVSTVSVHVWLHPFHDGIWRVKMEPWAPSMSWRGMSLGPRVLRLPQLCSDSFASGRVSGVLIFAQKNDNSTAAHETGSYQFDPFGGPSYMTVRVSSQIPNSSEFMTFGSISLTAVLQNAVSSLTKSVSCQSQGSRKRTIFEAQGEHAMSPKQASPLLGDSLCSSSERRGAQSGAGLRSPRREHVAMKNHHGSWRPPIPMRIATDRLFWATPSAGNTVSNTNTSQRHGGAVTFTAHRYKMGYLSIRYPERCYQARSD